MVAHGCQCGERPCPVRMETMSNSWVLMIELQLHQNWGHFYSLLLKGCALLLLSACLPIEGISRHLVSTKVESKANSWLMITGLPLGYLMDNHNPWETVWTNPPEALTSANDLSTTIAGTLGIAESAECDCLDGEVTFWQDSGYLRDSRSAYIIKNGWMTMTMHVFWAPLISEKTGNSKKSLRFYHRLLYSPQVWPHVAEGFFYAARVTPFCQFFDHGRRVRRLILSWMDSMLPWEASRSCCRSLLRPSSSWSTQDPGIPDGHAWKLC